MAEPSPDAIKTNNSHLGGITRLCFSRDGATIFTAGSDCLVRIHKADNPESEPGFHDDHHEDVTCLASSSDQLITGSVDNIVRHYSYPQNEFLGFVTRSSGVPIRFLDVDKAGERVAVCSDDMVVKIVDLKDTSIWSQTTICCDGKLKIYDTTGSTAICVKVFEAVVYASESDSKSSCYAQWHPSGAYFAVPTRTNDIAIYNRDSWTKQSTFVPDGPKALIGELTWSPNGRYLAASAAANIYVFSTDTRQPVAAYTCPKGAISALAFSPISNLLAFTSLDGSFHRWSDPISNDLADPVSDDETRQRKFEQLLDDEFGDDDGEIQEKGEDLGDDELFGDDAWIVDDDGKYTGYGKDEEDKPKGRTAVGISRAQEAFEPGSTSFRNKKRYLAFNMIGVIDVTDQETHNVVNVEFHDRSARRGYHFQDHHKYTLASLGEQGIVYACESEDEQPSIVYYRPYDSWTTQADWQIDLSPGENAVCVAAGGGPSSEQWMGSVVVATSKGFVRFFTASGVQRYLWSLGEDIITMAAGRGEVVVVHREGPAVDGCQNLRYTLLDLDTFDIIQEGKIPLPRKIELDWIGFTSEGVPAIYDSAGLLSVLDRHRRPGQARWVPLLDTTSLAKDGRKEAYWPVGVSQTHMSCIILKGLEVEPWFPRPLLQEIELRMPMLNMIEQQGKSEESLARGSLTLFNLSPIDPEASYTKKETEVALDKEILQLIQGACKADKLQRALDLARLVYQPESVKAASTIAAFYHLPGLKDRILNVRGEKEKKGKERKLKEKEMERARGKDYTGVNQKASMPEASSSRQFQDFAPRSRRAVGSSVNRDSTPASSNPVYVPETPGEDVEMEDVGFGRERGGSPAIEKRKRDKEFEEFDAPSKKRGSEFPFAKPAAVPAKNPFAKKPAGSNPFAKSSGGATPLDGKKSTSFFDRVDKLETDGVPKTKKMSKKEKAAETAASGGKQTSLFAAGISKKSKKADPETPVEEEEERQETDIGDDAAETLVEASAQESLDPVEEEEEDAEEVGTQVDETQE
ncbi:hypothetical protein B9479_002344 [Cryptococcus floricola]|uniref:Uncharacterized protein n=1 Tax=Cryptococcus floricola TaxID=2591691 RepID=A0A5D3B2X8_9TREE|nr:hypothetical protein B9479_002344 [Cryptococcus floricola]